MKKKVLLAGSSFSAVPLLINLRKRGFFVLVCGNNKEDPCHEYSDESIYMDYSNPNLIEDFLLEHNFEYIVPSCNDAAYLSCAEIACKYDFPGFDDLDKSKTLHTKALFRNKMEEIGLSIPLYSELTLGTDIKSINLRYPLIIKPIDSFSGRGMTKINNDDECENAVGKALAQSKYDKVLLEEFVVGTLHSHSAFILNNNILDDFFVDEFCSVYQYQVDYSNHPSRLAEASRENIRAQIDKMVKTLGLCNGLLHTQFIDSPTGPVIIECMRRHPGDLYSMLIEKSTGYDYTNSYVSGFLGESISKNNNNKLLNYSRHTISQDKKNIFKSLKFLSNNRQTEYYPLKTSGQYLSEAPFDKLGIVFQEYDSFENMVLDTPESSKTIKLVSYSSHESSDISVVQS